MLVVVGSCNIDLVLRLDRAPTAGETRIARSLSLHNGGKGANQAVAASRAGAQVRLLGGLGQDPYGDRLYQALTTEGIDLSALSWSQLPTGTACIFVEDSGDNRIAIYPGANRDIPLANLETQIAGASHVLAQLEVDPQLVTAAARICRAQRITFVLNASPAAEISPELLALADILLVNAEEAAQILGASVSSAMEAAARLAQGRQAAIITLGKDGAAWANATGQGCLPAHPVAVEDSTGCGDAFAGVLVAALAAGATLPTAIARANAAAALTATALGAQDAMPSRLAIDQFLASQ